MTATTLVNITPSQDPGARSDQKLRCELGEGVLKLLADGRTEDICLGTDCTLWVKYMNQLFESVGKMPPGQAQTALGTIVTIKKTVIRHERPILETERPLDGNRFGGLVSPIVRSLVSAVRLKSRRVFRLREYEESEITGTSRRRNAIPVVQNGVRRQVLQRIPIPVIMWNPLMPRGKSAPLGLFDSGIIEIGGQRAAILVCYEELLTWPILESGLDRPTLIIGWAIDNWARDTPIPINLQQALTAIGERRLVRCLRPNANGGGPHTPAQFFGGTSGE